MFASHTSRVCSNIIEMSACGVDQHCTIMNSTTQNTLSVVFLGTPRRAAAEQVREYIAVMVRGIDVADQT